MQYLECLSVSLQDMSYTYQPAERMHIVLQAVVAELRGMPVDSGNGYSRTVPARRGSVSMEGVEIPSFTKRRNIARLGSQRSQSQRPTSMNLDLNIDPMLSLVSLRKLSDNDSERPDSFMLATPRSEGMSSWRGIPDASGMESTTAVSTNGLPHLTDSGSTWMGTELDAHDISHLASVHFPELRDMPSIGEDGDANNGSTLDFLSFTAPGDEWKEWRPGESNGLNGQDMDRLTSSSVFANGLSGTPGRFENRMAAFVEGM
jgi:hypothetical protein